MSTTPHIYETTIIVNASLEDAQIDAVIGRVQDTIVKNGGTIDAVNRWGRKRLAYPIHKKTNGFYANLEFTAPATLLPVLERTYQLDELILRTLTIQLDKKALAARQARTEPSAAAEPAPPPSDQAPPFEKEEESKQ
jgi:small subunit ribosomal protein S6